jgi:RHS repeat-associated protein
LANILTTIVGATTIQSVTNSYDADGNIVDITDNASSHTGLASATVSAVSYDDLNRLISANWSASGGYGSKNYTYDSIGNLTLNGEFGAGIYNYGSARPHLVKSANGVNYTCDLNGNVNCRGGQLLCYDVNDHLSQVVGPNLSLVTFGYDADGERLWEQVKNQPLKVWVGDIYEENDGKVLYNIMANGRRVCSFEPAAGGTTGYDPATQEFYYYHSDYLTSSSLITERNGAEVQHYEYSAFGQSRYTQSSTAFVVSHRFTGQVFDPDTGLYYYGARYYDPQLGKFIQPDDTIPNLWNPQSYDRYAYCLNDPFRYTDPDGRAAMDWANSWSGQIEAGAAVVSAGPSHWVWNGTIGTIESLANGIPDALRFGSTAGELSGQDSVTGKQIAIGTLQELSRAATLVPVATGATKLTGAAVDSLVAGSESEAAGELGRIKPGCFVAGTLVPTENGEIEIQNLKIGDRVWSYSLETGQWELRSVEATPVRNYNGDIERISVGGTVVVATANHPFWIIDGNDLSDRPPASGVPENERATTPFGRWVEARSLRAGDVTWLLDGETAPISAVSGTNAHVRVYNLTVEGNHTYSVSGLGVLVHNGCGQDLTPRAARRQAMRDAGVPTSQQPRVQVSVKAKNGTKVGRQYTYDKPTSGGGNQTISVQHSLTDSVKGHGPHWEAGPVKPGGQTDSVGRPRLTGGKVKVHE